MGEMVQGLRDRDFIQNALGRYVSPELAERCLPAAGCPFLRLTTCTAAVPAPDETERGS